MFFLIRIGCEPVAHPPPRLQGIFGRPMPISSTASYIPSGLPPGLAESLDPRLGLLSVPLQADAVSGVQQPIVRLKYVETLVGRAMVSRWGMEDADRSLSWLS